MDQANAKDRTAKINDQLVTLRPRETLLDAALRSGVDFPNSCRVGGCGSCKCKLAEGTVRELTETGYLLSEREIEEGYILACQSVATSDVRIEVDLAPSAAKQKARGRVIAQEKVTHDITRLSVKLDEALSFRAGQYAELRFDAMPDARRSYSFAAPPSEEDVLEFFVRKVPGGALSSFINDRDVRGEALTVEGPSGDFWLRDGDEPVLMVAGGSGLAADEPPPPHDVPRGGDRRFFRRHGLVCLLPLQRSLRRIDCAGLYSVLWGGVGWAGHLAGDAPLNRLAQDTQSETLLH